jgi:dihydroorotase
MNQAITISNGRLIDPENGIDEITDLHILNDLIVAIGQPPRGFSADLTIDATDRVVCPGLIDLSAKTREPGQEQKGTIASETAAAASGGITTLCCPPNTVPVIDSVAVVELVQHKAKEAGFARVLPIGAMTQGLKGETLSEMAALKEAGCVAVGNASNPLGNTLIQRRAMEYAATFDITTFLRSEDRHLKNEGCVHEGRTSTRLGLPGIPEAAEAVAVARDLALAEQTGARIHFRGLSTGIATRMISEAWRHNPAHSADVAIYHLFLTENDLDGFNSDCHVLPPLRTTDDRDMLRHALAKGVINAICSDHQPHEPEARMAPFQSTATGISGLDSLLGLSLKLVQEGVLPLSDAIARLTSGPAKILGLPLGQLGVGSTADVCIYDPDQPWQLLADKMRSKGHNTPFLGWEFTGQVTHTLFEGNIVYQRDSDS